MKKALGMLVVVLCFCGGSLKAQENIGTWSSAEAGHAISQGVSVKAKSDCPGCFGTVTFSSHALGVRSDSPPKTGTVTSETVSPAPPFPVSTPERIVYPRKAVLRGWEGQAVVAAEVLPDGSVGRTALAKTSGYEILDHAAQDAIKTWKFGTESENEDPVPQYVDIPVTFKLEDQ